MLSLFHNRNFFIKFTGRTSTQQTKNRQGYLSIWLVIVSGRITSRKGEALLYSLYKFNAAKTNTNIERLCQVFLERPITPLV